MRTLLDLLFTPVTAGLIFAALVLVVRAAELVPRLARADSLGLLAGLKGRLDPWLEPVAQVLHMPPARDTPGLLALGLAALAFLSAKLLELLRHHLQVALAQPRSRPSSRAPAPSPAAPAPAPAPAADPDATVVTGSDPGTGPTVVSAPTPPAAAAQRRLPERIGRFEVLGELGRGAMGVVYKARDPQLQRLVAIKTISIGLASDSAEGQMYRRRFLVEAQAAGRLRHPGIVSVYDVIDDPVTGLPCQILEYVEGCTLDKLPQLPPPLGEALGLVAQVARALAYAHRQGIVHRDIKPPNIMVTANGMAKVADFGIARLDGSTLTVAGQVMGTPMFMSPEQCVGKPVDARSDIFSLGSVLYWLTSGKRPFRGDNASAISYKLVHEMPVPARTLDPGLPPGLDEILDRCMAKDPQQRYASADDFAAALEALAATLSAAAPAPAAPAPAAPPPG